MKKNTLYIRKPSAVEHTVLTAPSTGANEEVYGAAFTFLFIPTLKSDRPEWKNYQSRRSRGSIVNDGEFHGGVDYLVKKKRWSIIGQKYFQICI